MTLPALSDRLVSPTMRAAPLSLSVDTRASESLLEPGYSRPLIRSVDAAHRVDHALYRGDPHPPASRRDSRVQRFARLTLPSALPGPLSCCMRFSSART